jgi:hydrogenase maturation protein HypF
MNTRAIRITVTGRVQGIGFRPTMYRLAVAAGLAGSVRNTSRGVVIEIEGQSALLDRFEREWQSGLPALARVASVATEEITVTGRQGFAILPSQREEGSGALIPFDVATCDACLAEVCDPDDRRHAYAFTNCTNCGPRYTIIESVPYDRSHTSMKVFPMCPACRAEYEDPTNRRYHAQPNACSTCGPQLTLVDPAGVAMQGDPVTEVRRLLAAGKIVAIRGVGGFHLAADATNTHAVEDLRTRKRRGAKPFAVLSPDVASISTYALVSDREHALLTSDRRPIVLLTPRTDSPLAPGIAPNLNRIGAMLPYSPLHHLLIEGFRALVFTSGNLSEEPIAKDNAEAFSRLHGLADTFLLHNREILMSCDDSVVYQRGSEAAFVRRSRGYAPDPIAFSGCSASILALGGQMKNTFCLTRGDEAFLSQHVGDLDNYETQQHFQRCLKHLTTLLGISPAIVACDLHPDYLSTRYALSLPDVRVVQVQHHHAHLAAAMADRGLSGQVIGLCLDGTGFGPDGTIWGGEVLLGGFKDYRRFARLKPFRLPGGEAAVREPWRSALGLLAACGGADPTRSPQHLFPGVERPRLEASLQLATRGVNAPWTSSLGRLFDAVAALLSVRLHVDYDGQAAAELEAAATVDAEGFAMPMIVNHDLRDLDPSLLVKGLLKGIADGRSTAELAAAFHRAVSDGLVAACEAARTTSGLTRVVVSGGCMLNRRLDRMIEQAPSGPGQ